MSAVNTSSKSAPSARLVTLKNLSVESGLPYTTLRALALRKELPHLRIGRAFYVERRDFDRFLERARA